jgi:hypothetical protein
VSTDLRQHLARLVAKKVDTHGVVVWEDPAGEYAGVAEAVCPSGAAFARWERSWYRLRSQLEGQVAGSEPGRLLVYQPVATPDNDPLAEIRAAGTAWRHPLSRLTRSALAGSLTPDRISELARQSRTFIELEAALAGGSDLGVRLPAALGSADTIEVALRILADETRAILDAEDLWGEAGGLLARAFGVPATDDGASLLEPAFRHLVLAELIMATGEAPAGLERAVAPSSAEQRRRASELLVSWRRDRLRVLAYRDRALSAETTLRLGQTMDWHPGLTGLDTLPVIEHLALGEVVRLLDEGHHGQARKLAEQRRTTSMWTDGQVPEASDWVPTWNAATAVGGLLDELASEPPPPKATVAELLAWYSTAGWRVDQRHRQMEEALTQLAGYGEMTAAISRARASFEAWVGDVMEAFTNAIDAGGLDTTAMLRQSEVHHTFLRRADEPVAYLLVDALRYELGEELGAALRQAGAEVELRPAVASCPTITPVGMASLLPGAEAGLTLGLDAADRLTVAIDGVLVAGVAPRVERLRAAHGEVVDLALTELFDHSESELSRRFGSAKVVLVRSQEIDEALESDKTAAGWSYIRELKTLLARAVAKLRHAGINRSVIASDHGFVILSRPVGADRVIERPGGQGDLHRRCWVGRGGATSASALRVPLTELGIGGGLDLVVPRGLGVFAAGGARRFFHGGLSPQEVVVPVLDVRFPALAEQPGGISAEVVGGRITTGVFSAKIDVRPDLFSTSAVLRVLARGKKSKAEVAEVAAGTGHDPASGTVTVVAGEPGVVTLRVSASLAKGDKVVLEVYDARTDRRLATSSPAEVVGEVRIDDDLD